MNRLPAIEGAEPLLLDVADVQLGGYAWWSQRSAPAVLLLHGWGEDASTMAPVAGQVRSRLWHAVSISLRGWPGSTGVDDYGLSAAQDIAGALDWIRAQPRVSSAALLGFSMGGLMASLAAAEQAPGALAGVTVVSAPSDLTAFYRDTAYDGVRRYLDATLQPQQWRDSSPLTHASRLVHPMLVVTGTRDSMTPPAQGGQLAEAAPNAQHMEVDGMDHRPSEAQWERILSVSAQLFGL
ncbi:alpha/beta fold hydrolase [Nesterenkonia sp.]|uniref:alpha/beta hydrolase family protein n=1 Tax=Nesterenkonia sp. TaxID=704201 RepID=UPI002603F917|nr:alpha/beta fold hydrolase [Nesterenkonia sp.]